MIMYWCGFVIDKQPARNFCNTRRLTYTNTGPYTLKYSTELNSVLKRWLTCKIQSRKYIGPVPRYYAAIHPELCSPNPDLFVFKSRDRMEQTETHGRARPIMRLLGKLYNNSAQIYDEAEGQTWQVTSKQVQRCKDVIVVWCQSIQAQTYASVIR